MRPTSCHSTVRFCGRHSAWSLGLASLLILGGTPLAAVDQPPTIIVPASATPAVVTGKTAKVSVQASDDGGPAGLTFTWTASGPGPVKFSGNGSAAAKTSTATFTRAGQYRCEVLVRDAGSQSATSAVNIEVQAVPGSLTVSPASLVLNPGATRALAANPKDQFGQALAIPVQWTCSDAGSVDATGVFTAGAVPGSASVVAAAGGHSASAAIRVNAAPTASLVPWGAVSGTSALVSAVGSDPDDPATSLVYRWSATGPKAVAFSPNGNSKAGTSVARFTAAGSYLIQVVVQDPAGLQAVCTQAISVEAVPMTVSVSPQAASTVVNPGATRLFTATVRDQFHALLALPVAWSVAPETAGSFASTGLFTAAEPGPATVCAQVGPQRGLAPLRVNAPPVVLSPLSTTAAAPFSGRSAGFAVRGGDDADPVLLSYTWSATGPRPVVFVPRRGVDCTETTGGFAQVGDYTIIASIRDQQGLSVSSCLPLSVLPEVSGAALAPAQAVLLAGAKRTFTAQLLDQFAKPIPGAAPRIRNVVAVGGTASASGATCIFTAGTVQGSASLHVELDTEPPRSASAQIEITDRLTLDQPQLSPAAGTSNAPFVAQVISSDPHANALRYRRDATAPTPADPLWPAEGLAIERSQTVSVRAFGPSPWKPSPVLGVAYELQVPAPSLNPPGGTYLEPQTVTLSCSSTSAWIVCTRDGSDPLSSPSAETLANPASLTLAEPVLLTAVAIQPGWSPSAAVSAAYQIIDPPTNQAPVILSGPTLIPDPVTGIQAQVRIEAEDPDGDPLSYAWTATGPAPVGLSGASGPAAVLTFSYSP